MFNLSEDLEQSRESETTCGYSWYQDWSSSRGNQMWLLEGVGEMLRRRESKIESGINRIKIESG